MEEEKIRNLFYQSKIGYITGEMQSDGYFMVYKFVLYPEFRGKGLAKELAKHIPKKAKLLADPVYSRNREKILETEPLISFYKNIGFELRPDEYGNNLMFRENYSNSFNDYLILENLKL